MRRSLIACSLTLGLTLFTAEAAAQRNPIPYVDRPLTLPEKTLRIDADFPAFRPGAGDAFFGFFAGAGFGITDDFEVFGRVIPITFIPDRVRFQDPVIGATYRFLDNDTVQIGVGGRIQVPVDDGRYFIFNPRLPIQLKLGDIVRLDTGVNLSLGAPTGPGNNDAVFALAGPGPFGPFPFSIDPGIPARFSFQLVDQAWLGVNTGAGFLFTDGLGSGEDVTYFMPLGFGGGGTIPISNDMMMDIHGGFEFPLFLNTASKDTIFPDFWLFDIGARFYLDL
ncbi:MAG: hypothetical protein WKG00_28010 [Polyangiaceae bacterium]